MINKLSEVIPLQASIDTLGSSATVVKFDLSNMYAEFDLRFVAWDPSKSLQKDDVDRTPVNVKIFNDKNISYVRDPADIFALNEYFALPTTKPFVAGGEVISFVFSHDNTIVTASPSPLVAPITCVALLIVNYLTKEEFEARKAIRNGEK